MADPQPVKNAALGDLERACDQALNLRGRVQSPSDARTYDAGAYGDIYRGLLDKKLPVAIKTIRIPSGSRYDMEHARQAFIQETRNWLKLNHRNILPFYGYTDAHDARYKFPGLVSPWIDKNAANYFYQYRSSAKPDRVAFLAEVAQGVAYLHRENIYHGDLKAKNILVAIIAGNDGEPYPRPLICDFGLSKNLEDISKGISTGKHAGTKRWMPRERLMRLEYGPQRRALIYRAGDVWMWGMTALEIFTSAPPYAGECKTEDEAADMIKAMRLPEVSISKYAAAGLTVTIWDQIKECWTRAPDERPTMQAVVDFMWSRTNQLNRDYPNEVSNVHGYRPPTGQFTRTKPIRGISMYMRAKFDYDPQKDSRPFPSDVKDIHPGDWLAVTKRADNGRWGIAQLYRQKGAPHHQVPRQGALPRNMLHMADRMVPFIFRSTFDHKGYAHAKVEFCKGDMVVVTGGSKRNDPISRENMQGAALQYLGVVPFPPGLELSERRMGPTGFEFWAQAQEGYTRADYKKTIDKYLALKKGDIIGITADWGQQYSGELIGRRDPVSGRFVRAKDPVSGEIHKDAVHTLAEV